MANDLVMRLLGVNAAAALAEAFQVLVGVWLAGIAAPLVLLAIGQRRALAQFDRIIGDAQDPRVARASNPRVGPAPLGTLRPRVILPSDFEAQFDARQQAMILAHR